MKRLIHRFIALSLLLALIFPVSALAAEEPSVLSVNGSGEKSAIPDSAALSVGIITKADNSESAQKDNAVLTNSVINALKNLGIKSEDIKTGSYSFSPEYSRDEEREIIGYTVTNSLNVHVNELALVSKVIDTSLASGANRVHFSGFTVKDTSALKKGALLAAIADAREKADIIAQGLGKSIIGIKTVTESLSHISPLRVASYKFAAMNDAAGATPIEGGTVSVNAEVHIEFILSR